MTEYTRRNKAYSSFLFLGLVALWAAYIGGGSPEAHGLAMIFAVIVPFGIPVVIELILGVRFNFSCRRWDPVLVSRVLVSFAIAVVCNSTSFYYDVILFAVYGGFCVVASILWFTRFRHRLKKDLDIIDPPKAGDENPD